MEYFLVGVISLAVIFAVVFVWLFVKALVNAAKMPRDELHRRVVENKAAKALKSGAVRPKQPAPRKKGGALGGSHAVEAMLLDKNYDPVNVWAARKVRDKFFRF